MISLESKAKHESTALPGVTFVIRKYTEGLRYKIAAQVAGLAREHNELGPELEPLQRSYREAFEAAPEDAKPTPPAELLALIERRQNIVAMLDHVWIQCGFVKAEGVEVDGRPLTAESLIEVMPNRAFYEEVRDAIKREYGLTEKEKGESAPPTTSGAVEGGEKKSTNADTASVMDSIQAETAAAISPEK